MPHLKGEPPKEPQRLASDWTLEEWEALPKEEAMKLIRSHKAPPHDYLQNKRIIELLEKQNEMLEFLVAAEYQNAQATEGLMKAFEGKSQERATDAFYNQRLLGGPTQQ